MLRLLLLLSQVEEDGGSLSGKLREEPKPEGMEVEERKPHVKAEPKEEEEGGANGTAPSTSPTQLRRKSESPEIPPLSPTSNIELFHSFPWWCCHSLF